jgi:hypothetical protein
MESQKHLKRVCDDNELELRATIKKYLIVQKKAVGSY